MSSITTQIQAAAPRNRELLTILSETDHASPALEQQRRYLADLETELKSTQQQIRVLDRKREKELKEHVQYRDSVMKRLAYKVGRKTDKFEARAAKEEREYFDVLQEEHRAKDQEKSLKQLREDALRARDELEALAAKHAEAQKELDGLYDSIFQGPTPDFPEEDDKERSSGVALQTFHDARVQSEAGTQALNSLTDASRRLQDAMTYIEEALSYSRMDMFGGGAMTDMMERNALHNAEMKVSEGYWLVSQAQRMAPGIQPLPPIGIAQGSIMSDVFFDNIFTDMAFHDKIKASKEDLVRATSVLNGQLAAARQRQQGLDGDANNKSLALEASRSELQKARERIFESTAGGAAVSEK
jgi:hypothetical protein